MKVYLTRDRDGFAVLWHKRPIKDKPNGIWTSGTGREVHYGELIAGTTEVQSVVGSMLGVRKGNMGVFELKVAE